MPPIAPAIAFYLLATRLHIFDTYWVLMLVNSMASIPFVVWIMKGFIDEIPTDRGGGASNGAPWWKAMKDHILPGRRPAWWQCRCLS